MSIIEIISGSLLLLSSISIILLALLQESKQPGMNAAIGGGSNDSFYGKNSNRSREAQLVRLTKICAGVFFVVTILVNIFTVIF